MSKPELRDCDSKREARREGVQQEARREDVQQETTGRLEVTASTQSQAHDLINELSNKCRNAERTAIRGRELLARTLSLLYQPNREKANVIRLPEPPVIDRAIELALHFKAIEEFLETCHD